MTKWDTNVTGANPNDHSSRHENGGDDEISVTGLSGLLADDQHVLDAEVQAIKLDDFTAPDDNTDLDASTSKHGLMSKNDKVKLDGVEASADVTDSTNVNAAGAVMESDFDAGTFLYATSDNTPQPKTVAEVITILGLPQFAKAYVKMDLSGSAVTNNIILHTSRACTLLKGIIVYTEASSADAGVAITIGKESDADYYYTGNSETEKALWYEKDITLLQSDIAAGDTVICGCAGGKVGDGEVLVCIEFKVN